ncbi:hypothetical protein [Micromonospora violae]|uniref:hypothetical protein n=1 Tax=Micromonospora violae TaxID=1278207 RepID=UPI0033EE73E2
MVLGALGWGRPVALVRDTHQVGHFAAAATESEHLDGSEQGVAVDPSASPGSATTFVLPPLFRRRRTRAIATRVARCRPFSIGPIQQVHAVGVGPWVDERAKDLLPAADVVMTDWTYVNTFARISGAGEVTPHVVPYQFDDFDANIESVDSILRDLQEKGVTRATLLIEGNPDTYDVLDGLSLQGRLVTVTPGVPIGLLAVNSVGHYFARDPLQDSFAYFSGLHSRHRTPPEQFLGELTCYLAAGVSCVLVEMFRGDVDLALRAMELAGGAVTAVLMSDFFSESAHETIVTSGSGDDVRRALETTRGRLTTMLITKERLS